MTARRLTIPSSPPAAPDAGVPRAALLQLRRLLEVFELGGRIDGRRHAAARKQARAGAIAALERESETAEQRRMAAMLAAATMFAGLRSELAAAPEHAAEIAERLELEFGISRACLAREVLRDPQLLTLLPAVAVQAQLALLTALAPLRSASLWVIDDGERVSCKLHVGEGAPSRRAGMLAQSLFAGAPPQSGSRGLLVGRRLGRWQRPLGVLVISARPGLRDAAAPFLDAGAPMLGAILERDALLTANSEAERTLVQSSERKLTRLGFDLHDGPIQDVAALADDLRLFWSQVEEQLSKHVGRASECDMLRGRKEDLDAQISRLDTELRRISNEVRAASVLLNRPFAAALQDVGRAFAARTDIEPRLVLRGDLTELTNSQQIALLNIIHEALTNVREHSGASAAEISVATLPGGVRAVISDNGCGFDLEPTLMQAASEGRLGLLGMHERVRLLGGQLKVDSRPGGPTRISVTLDRWEPILREASGRRASA